jgi:acetoin utilization deacetylase AcuC-like enzyme
MLLVSINYLINQHSFNQSVLAQSAWLDAIDFILDQDQENGNDTKKSPPKVSFCLTRPPGHHAEFDQSMGFCLFNFAAGAARYAHEKGVNNVAILDYDVHFGNGIASLVDKNTRYASLHQGKIFPYGRGGIEETGKYGNVLCSPLEQGCKWPEYEPALRNRAIPFLKEFNPELLIVSAGFDALSSDELAGLNLLPIDYQRISEIIKEEFADVKGILFGLEGGYNVKDLPIAIEHALLPFLSRDAS